MLEKMRPIIAEQLNVQESEIKELSLIHISEPTRPY